MAKRRAAWAMLDAYDPVPNEFPRIPVTSEDHLLQLVDKMNLRPPNVVILEGPSEKRLTVGLGGQTGFLRFRDNKGQMLMAFAPKTVDNAEKRKYVDFSFEGVDYRVFAANLLCIDLIRQTLVSYYRTEQFPDSVTWGERTEF